MIKVFQHTWPDAGKYFPDNFFDSVVTDPPYGISFMGQQWDYDLPGVDAWKEVLRVLKPGGHILVACGTRTQHRMAVNIEGAGFEIRDIVSWIYGQGFPKSLNIGNGWGTALKPAQEFWTLARKALSEKTVAANVLKWGTGGINIDGCRIALDGEDPPSGSAKRVFVSNEFNNQNTYGENKTTRANGRFPANVILDEEAGAMLDEQTGVLTSGTMKAGTKRTAPFETRGGFHGKFPEQATANDTYADSGGASRFFYCAKASKSERNKGLEDFEKKEGGMRSETSGQHITRRDGGAPSPVANHHPTVKPIALMRYLCKLITPPGGIILDPYGGSGSTGIAAKLEGFAAVLIEREKEYCNIAAARINAHEIEIKKEKLQTALEL